MPETTYIGRFAPSPTGDLHFGSLTAAVGSYLQARRQGGIWLVRIEDIDPAREIEGSAQSIIRDMARLGLQADRAILCQSTRLDAYRHAWERLLRNALAFRCECSRKMLPASGIYPGTCRGRTDVPARQNRIRLKAPAGTLGFVDRIMGKVEQDLRREVGDFVIRRADGWPAYQLAVVVDDDHQGITEVVRGADLLESTPRQIALQRALGLPTPGYCHLPVAVLPDGSKLSKQLGSDPIRSAQPAAVIAQALEFLGHRPPTGLALDQVWSWGIEHWDPDQVPARRELPVPEGVLRP